MGPDAKAQALAAATQAIQAEVQARAANQARIAQAA
jgi:FMN-dependent NADH-azoreductase